MRTCVRSWIIIAASTIIVGVTLAVTFHTTNPAYGALPLHFLLVSSAAAFLVKHIIQNYRILSGPRLETQLYCFCMLFVACVLVTSVIWIMIKCAIKVRSLTALWEALMVFFRVSHVGILGLALSLLLWMDQRPRKRDRRSVPEM